MKRENRKKLNSYSSLYVTLGILLLALIAFIVAFIVYSNKLDEELYSFDSEYIAQYTNNEEKENTVETTTTSSTLGKTIEESKQNVIEKEENTIISEKEDKNTNNEKTIKKSSNKEEKDPTFIKPVEGEISKEYAKDSLIYSETLKEWITHLGVDILADKTTVVKAAADGKIKYIKNDPRYGLTVIIEHSNGYQTLYANLLTTDFISEGESVTSGQTIGTVGDSSVYEIADESHLHFEITKDGENVNPCDYIKF